MFRTFLHPTNCDKLREARAECPRTPHEVINELAHTINFDEMKPAIGVYHRFVCVHRGSQGLAELTPSL
jgi:hypothetical protein